MRIHYPAKILLFGEHLLLTGASALTLPLPTFSGRWQWQEPGQPGTPRQARLLEFAQCLERKQLINNTFHANLQKGLFFESNIPEGYGMGSSGALCAAIYADYALYHETDPAALKATFSEMESFFHGSSSGIDPLTSYLERPLLIRNKTEVALPTLAKWPHPPALFLLDTCLPRQTGPLVQWFLAQWETPAFRLLVEQELLPAHEAALAAWLQADAGAFWPALRQLSVFQLRHFLPMVPEAVRLLWQQGLDSGDYYLKICGAGGGGFMLGFAPEGLPGLAHLQSVAL